MSPSFDEIVEWLKSLEEGEPLPKPTLVGRPAVMSQREPFPPAGAFPAAGAFPSPTALPAPASQLAQASQMADVARTEETPAEKPAAKPARPVELHDSSGSAVAADFGPCTQDSHTKFWLRVLCLRKFSANPRRSEARSAIAASTASCGS